MAAKAITSSDMGRSKVFCPFAVQSSLTLRTLLQTRLVTHDNVIFAIKPHKIFSGGASALQ